MMLVKYKSDNPVCPRYFSIHFCLIQHFFHFSCPDSSPLSKHWIGTLVILSSWSISQKCKIRICSGQLSVSVFIPLSSFHVQAAVGVSDVMIARELTVQTQRIFRSFPTSTEKDSSQKSKFSKKILKL